MNVNIIEIVFLDFHKNDFFGLRSLWFVRLWILLHQSNSLLVGSGISTWWGGYI